MADPVSKLQVLEAPIPVPGAGEVLVHMRMRPVDPADFFSIMGVYPGFQAKAGPDAVPGLEGMGVIAKLGGGDTKGFKVGARVVPMNWGKAQAGSGTWTEYLVAKVEDLVDVPDSVSDESAAQLLVNPLTAIAMLDVLAAPAGNYVLQSAGGSALGKQLIQIAKSRGLKTISTVILVLNRSNQKGPLIRRRMLGCRAGIVHVPSLLWIQIGEALRASQGAGKLRRRSCGTENVMEVPANALLPCRPQCGARLPSHTTC